MVLLQASGIRKSYGQLAVLKGIDLEINRGEIVAIVGASGAGKSTLLHVLGTLDTPDHGKVLIENKDVFAQSSKKLAAFRNHSIGFVFQFHFLLPEFTALQNVMIPAEKLGKYTKSEIEDRAYEKLKWLGMHEFAGKLSSKLSGGQQQRVAIARALINDPTIIMGDEPTGNLDSTNTNIVFDMLKDLSKSKGQTIISVTHDEEFALKSDRVIEMKDGQIIKQ